MTRTFEVIRPCMFFAKTQLLTYGKLHQYFTGSAISKLEKFGYLRRLSKEEIEANIGEIIDIDPIK